MPYLYISVCACLVCGWHDWTCAQYIYTSWARILLQTRSSIDTITLMKIQVDRPDLHHCVRSYGSKVTVSAGRSGTFVTLSVSLRHGYKHDTASIRARLIRMQKDKILLRKTNVSRYSLPYHTRTDPSRILRPRLPLTWTHKMRIRRRIEV